MQDSLENNKIKLINTLGDIIKKHRISQSKSIYKISAECSMSKSTWREAELGICKDINLSTLWKISEGLNIALADTIIELQLELGEKFSLADLY